MQLFVEQDSWSRASLAGSRWSWEGDKLTVQLQANGKKALEACIPGVRRYLADRFGRQVSIEIQAHGELEGPGSLPPDGENALGDGGAAAEDSRPCSFPGASGLRSPQERRFGNVRWGYHFWPALCGPGRSHPGCDPGYAHGVWPGGCLLRSIKSSPKNNAIVVNFDITDYTGSIRINRYFRERDLPKAQAIVGGYQGRRLGEGLGQAGD